MSDTGAVVPTPIEEILATLDDHALAELASTLRRIREERMHTHLDIRVHFANGQAIRFEHTFVRTLRHGRRWSDQRE